MQAGKGKCRLWIEEAACAKAAEGSKEEGTELAGDICSRETMVK